MTWPYLLLSLRARFGMSADEFLSLTYWQAWGYLQAIPFVLGVEDKGQKEKGTNAADLVSAGVLGRG